MNIDFKGYQLNKIQRIMNDGSLPASVKVKLTQKVLSEVDDTDWD